MSAWRQTMLLLGLVNDRFLNVPQLGTHLATWYIGLAAVLALITLPFGPSVVLIGFVMVVWAALGVVVWWLLFVRCLIGVTTPQTLALVPQIASKVVIALTLIWISLIALMSTIFVYGLWFPALVFPLAFAMTLSRPLARAAIYLAVAIAVAGGLAWSFSSGLPSLPRATLSLRVDLMITVWSLTGGILALVAMASAFPVAAILFLVCWPAAIFVSERMLGIPFQDLLQLVYDLTTRTVAHAAMALVPYGLAVYGLVGIRGDRRLDRYKSAGQLFVTVARSATRPTLAGRWRLLLLPGYGEALNRALMAKVPPRDYFVHVLGLPASPSRVTALTGLLGALIGGGLVGFLFRHHWTAEPVLLQLMVMLVLWQASVGTALAIVLAVDRSRREQAFLALAPLWPSGPAQNRMLVRNFVRRMVIASSVALACSVSATLAASAPLLILQPPLIVFAVYFLTAVNIVLYDYGSMTDPESRLNWRLISLAMVPALAMVIALSTWTYANATAATWIVALAALAIIRYRKFVNGASMLPAGRAYD